MNPVLLKDLLGLLRLKRVAAVQVCFVAVLALLVMATWPQTGIVAGSVAVAGTDSATRIDDRLLLGLVIGQIVLLILFVPGIAAVALTSEKEANTLEMLYASRLTPAQIIWGKVGLAIGYPILLLISGLPFAAMLALRGDVAMSDLVWAYIFLVVTSLYLSMLSLVISSLTRLSATALVITYATVLVICGAVLVPAAIMLDQAEGIYAQLLHYVRGVSPVAAALSRFRGQLIDAGPARQMWPIWQVFLPIAALVIVGSFVIVAAKLRKNPAASEGFGAIGGGTLEHRSLARKVMFLIDPKKKRRPFGWFNPVFTKERRTSNLSSGRWMIRIFYGALFLSLVLAVMSLFGGAEHADLLKRVALVLVAFQIGLIGLIVPSLSSSAVSSEIENQTFETLRLARLRGGQIFWGKFLPAFLPALLPVLALLPAYGAICYVNEVYLVYFRNLLPTVLTAVLFCCTLGLVCSSFVSQTARATVVAYLIAAGLFVLPLFGWWATGQQLSERVGNNIAFLSPLAMAINIVASPASKLAAMGTLHVQFMIALCVAMIIASRLRLWALLKQG